ncbi:MAG: FxsA family protein [Pseudomonadales bacterium]|jgi:UPF0716 protein FxsA|nr:FxsA family protein [Cellvibrionales bacterium]MBP8030418.1 FxsA family protein [Pseudomonadales bacterium]
MRVFLWLFLAMPLIELWFMIRVGSELGALTTLFLLVMAGIIGMNLLRQQSFNTLLRVDQRLQMGEMPAAEILEGFVLTLAAVLLIIPGFITDVLAIPLLIPPLRHWLVKRFLRTAYYQQHYYREQPAYREQHTYRQDNGQHNDIIDGEFRREDDPRLP